MTLKDFLEANLQESSCSKMQADGATYKQYYAAVMKSFKLDTKTPIFKLSKAQKSKLDSGWKSAEEKKGKE